MEKFTSSFLLALRLQGTYCNYKRLDRESHSRPGAIMTFECGRTGTQYSCKADRNGIWGHVIQLA